MHQHANMMHRAHNSALLLLALWFSSATSSDRSDCIMHTEKGLELMHQQRWDDSIAEMREALGMKASVNAATWRYVTDSTNAVATALHEQGWNPPADIEKHYDATKPPARFHGGLECCRVPARGTVGGGDRSIKS